MPNGPSGPCRLATVVRTPPSSCNPAHDSGTRADAGAGHGAPQRRADLPPRLPIRADAGHADLADAAGRPLHGRVPRPPRPGLVPRALQDPRAGRRGHRRRRVEARRRCRDPLRRHPADPRAAGTRPRVLEGRRAGHPRPDPDGRRRRPAPAARDGRTARLRHRGRSADPRGPAAGRPADRLRRRAVHPRLLRDRGRRLAELREGQDLHVPRPRRLGRADGPARRRDGRLPARAGGGRGPGPPALR